MLTTDGVELAVSAWGPDDAPLTIVLVHCWTFNRQDWHYQIGDLYREVGDRVRILAWDHRGHGRSAPVDRAGATIDHLARDMGEVIDAFAPTGELVIAGHSIGGMTMMAFGPQRPDVLRRTVGAVFCDTSPGGLADVNLGIRGLGARLVGYAPGLMDRRARMVAKRHLRTMPFLEGQVMSRIVFGSPMRRIDGEVAVSGMLECPPETVSGFYEDMLHHHEREGDLPAWTGIPTKVLVGSRDRLTPPAHARRIAAGIPGAELTVVPGAGHMLPQERDPVVTAAILDLVRPHLPAAT